MIKAGQYFVEKDEAQKLEDPVVVILRIEKDQVYYTGLSHIEWYTSIKGFKQLYRRTNKLVGLMYVGLVSQKEVVLYPGHSQGVNWREKNPWLAKR